MRNEAAKDNCVRADPPTQPFPDCCASSAVVPGLWPLAVVRLLLWGVGQTSRRESARQAYPSRRPTRVIHQNLLRRIIRGSILLVPQPTLWSPGEHCEAKFAASLRLLSLLLIDFGSCRSIAVLSGGKGVCRLVLAMP